MERCCVLLAAQDVRADALLTFDDASRELHGSSDSMRELRPGGRVTPPPD